MASLKKKIMDALVSMDYQEIRELALKDRRVFGKLIALAYDKEDLLCWRAIEAMGICAAAVAREDPARVRNVVQRLIWSAREESGGMGWSAPELLAEIACASPQQFADIPPIIVSLHGEDEEKVFLKGVLWSIARMADAGIRDVPDAAGVVMAGLADPEPLVRGLAALAAGKAEIGGANERLRDLTGDENRFTVYEKGRLATKTVGQAAQEALGKNG